MHGLDQVLDDALAVLHADHDPFEVRVDRVIRGILDPDKLVPFAAKNVANLLLRVLQLDLKKKILFSK